ncbi:DNA internalization-related competence protein ComEC/Rec2 [Desulfitobacterium sp.]|uniref:DNA internalization-related competence protein ComEC/Rec2 n=1 Tax=Desulfitobacterium sp. TaxID=49981 RepID=UPI002C2CFDF3|nr:DNA internalization-related competence protein ComEC/Rec2 [Desulfitobacterium sp.]HVJ50168.1 DNA internalization-related competence protein ComEC/Rec2 [Desulfitobacterium sp.]
MKDIWVRRFAFLLVGGLLGVKIPETMRIWLLAVLLLLGLRLWFWRARDFFGQLLKPEILILAAGFVIGVLYGFTANSDLEKPLTLDKVQVTGVLKDWNLRTDGATGVFLVQDADLGLNGKTYRLRVYTDRKGNLPEIWSRTLPGDSIRFKARLDQPKPPGTPGQFDLPLYYAVRGQTGNLTAQGDAELLSMGRQPYSWQIREQVHKLLGRWPSEQTTVLEGILFGDSSQIPQEEMERYKITGVLHVFSASGSNVAFVLAIFWGVLRFLPPTLRILLTSSLLIFYAILCGGNPPIIRATLMGIFALLGRLGRGRVNSLRNLLLVGAVLFLWQPLILGDTGFQLSFLATWGIISLAPKLSEQKQLRDLPKLLRLALTTTLAAQIATLPILITAFHRLSLVGLLANLVVLTVLGSVFQLGLIGVLFSSFAVLAIPLFQVSLWLLGGVNEGLRFLALLPWADVWVINPGILFLFIWYGALAVFLIGKERSLFISKVWLRKLDIRINDLLKNLGISPLDTSSLPLKGLKNAWPVDCLRKNQELVPRLLGIFLIILVLWSPWNSQKEVSVSFIDVGQGDSILVETPDHHAVLIDTGPKTDRFDAGERIILPYLLEKRIKHLDALILTHSHEDHVGGALAILNNVPVDWVGVPEDGKAWDDVGQDNPGFFTKDSSTFTSTDLSLNSRLTTKLAQMEVNSLKAGDQVVVDSKLVLKVLGPGNVLTNTHSDPNNNSIVLKLEYGGQSVLLSGDMETEEMQEIAASGQDWTGDYFKEPHHGSRFSLNLDFLDSINPKAVFVSVGKNSFGHPDPKVLQYWQERHIPLYRTDESGTLELRLDEKGGVDLIAGR